MRSYRLKIFYFNKQEVLPEGWSVAVVCPIHKKGDPQICNNYRGIALLNVVYKILSNCILDRIKPIAEEVLGDYQGGFRPNRSTTDQIFSLRQIIEKSWEFNKSICIQFVGFKKAYDSVHRHSLINILKEFKFPNKLIKLIEATLQNTEIKIKVASELSEPATVRTGLRQGDAQSPILFNLILEKVIRATNCNNGIVLGKSNINILAYADDIAILGDTEETVKQVCRKLIMMASKVSLEINDGKTEYMILSRQDREYQQGQSMNVEEYVFKRVTHFKYLEHLITQDNDLKMEVSARIQKGNKSDFGLGKVLSSRTLSTNLKIQMYMTLIRPIVLYAAETWPLKKIEETRIKWAGHACWRVESIVRTTIKENPVGKRPLGRPRLRWEDCVKRDVENIEPEIPWRVVAEDRDRWREICLAVWSQ
ncbi:ribosome biogenesis protein TSR3 isoform X1 [Aphis craccivora]|uniref:Ribosome biogenesis protein TSR3 isoform X1 n=1 Tax=Aphis craccivora TaxID=307492 RepID=A0A6G0YDC0_APHCR|nr:ribosome biogenesis protein TSR3 isoform X1 [Aphis craccivora]